MTQTGFDFDAAVALRDAGLDRASNPLFRKGCVRICAKHAMALGHSLGLVTIDDVKRRMLNYGDDPDELGNAAGAIFLHNPDFEYAGSRKSEREKRHAGRIGLWRLKA